MRVTHRFVVRTPSVLSFIQAAPDLLTRIGPGVFVDLGQRGVGQRVAERLAVTQPAALDAKDRARRRARRKRRLRPGVFRVDATEVVAETQAQRLVIQIEFAFGLGPELGRGAAPAWNLVRLFMGEGRQDAFAPGGGST